MIGMFFSIIGIYLRNLWELIVLIFSVIGLCLKDFLGFIMMVFGFIFYVLKSVTYNLFLPPKHYKTFSDMINDSTHLRSESFEDLQRDFSKKNIKFSDLN